MEVDSFPVLPPLLDRPPSPPFFDPSTHPLGLEEEKEVPDELFNDLDDLDTEGFLSLDPLHKWETLSSLCTSPPKAPPSQLGSKLPALSSSSPPPQSPESTPRAETLKRSHSDRQGNSTSYSLPSFDSPSKTLPSSLSSLRDDLDELLCVERKLSEHERVYHTVTGGLPLLQADEEELAKKNVAHKVDELMENNLAPIETEKEELGGENMSKLEREEVKVENGKVEEARSGKRFVVEKCEHLGKSNQDESSRSGGGPIFKLGEYQARPRPKMQEEKRGGKAEPLSLQEEDLKAGAAGGKKSREGKGPRALRRRPGRRVTRQQRLARRSSINGHW